jgi:hypothetical protein
VCSQRNELKRQEAHVNIRLQNLQLARGAVIDKLVPRSTRPVSPVRDAPSVAQHTEVQPANGYDSEGGDEDDDQDEDALDQHSVMTLDGEIQPAPAAVQRYRQAYVENASDLSLGVDASGEDGVAVRRRTRLIEQAPSSPGLCAPGPVSLTAMSHGDQAGARAMRWRNITSCPLALTCSLGSVCSRAGFNECDRLECDRPRLQSTRLLIFKKWDTFSRLAYHGAAKCCAHTRATRSAFAGARWHGHVSNCFALA